MSRYTSLCVAIELCESARKIFRRGSEEKDTASEVIRELQDVARDVRYGGKWEGDCEVVAACMDYCAENMCGLCPYKRLQEQGCRRTSKKDAAAVIRQLAKQLKEKEEAIAEMEQQIEDMRGDAYDSDYEPAEPAEPADWQKEIMDAVEQGKLPY